MNNIVEHGMKIDLHIHSCISAHKDGKKVKNNTKENIPILVQKLNENQVNICALTDHDAFSYDIYRTLKMAESQDNSIEKVLPGVEFSVSFEVDKKTSVIHVIAIFSDTNEEKVKGIETVLNENRPGSNGAYSEEKFLQVLRIIDIDTILIAHQKNTLTSTKPKKNDANSLGNEKFFEFVYTDYFEAYEFKNKRYEVINKSFLYQNGFSDKIRFVTGTDCHDWSVYPGEDASEYSPDFPYTYAKCLPTFKGLVMAITDHTRLKTVDSFFNRNRKHIDRIELSSSGQEIIIPLSRGINVIIGDNSIGKSLLLHALTSFSKTGTMKLPNKVKEGYKKYLQQNSLKVKTRIPSDSVFCFDMQGEVRAKFEENKLNATEFLGEYFPPNIDPKPYQIIIENEIKRIVNYLERKFKLDAQIEMLTPFDIVIPQNQAESLTFVQNLRRSKQKIESIAEISSKLQEVLEELSVLQKLSLEEEDIEYISAISVRLKLMKQKYDSKKDGINLENERIEKVAKNIIKVAEKHKKQISDAQKRQSFFEENSLKIKETLIDIIKANLSLPTYSPQIQTIKILPNYNRIFDYEFISKLNVDELGTAYFLSKISSVLKSKKEIDWNTITESELRESLLRYDESVPVLKFFEERLREAFVNDFQIKNSIIYQGMDKYVDLSSGLDAKIYFDLLSYENSREGIYIIDQPEDNISQSAIKTYLLDRFKTMGENRQVIMVTHNPQFIVNLDIDNLIFITKESERIKIYSGALEFVCPEYSILDIVAKNIDGGLDSIRKRWKRYEKVTYL